MPISRVFLNISSRVPSEGALPRGPPHWAPFLEPPFIRLSKTLVDEPPSRFPSGAPMVIDARLQSLLYLSFRVPSKGALPPGSLQRAPIERCSTSRAPSNHLSKSAVGKPTPGCPTEPPAPMKRDARLQSLSFITYRVPSKGAPPPGSLTRAPIERDAP